MDVLERYCNATVVTILLEDELVNQAQAAVHPARRVE
jgi:hypothetical protein